MNHHAAAARQLFIEASVRLGCCGGGRVTSPGSLWYASMDHQGSIVHGEGGGWTAYRNRFYHHHHVHRHAITMPSPDCDWMHGKRLKDTVDAFGHDISVDFLCRCGMISNADDILNEDGPIA